MKKKQNENKFSSIVILLVVVAVGVAASLTCLFLSRDKPATLVAFPPLVRGVYGARVTDPGKYATVPGLTDALKKINQNNPCEPSEGRFKQIVLGVTANQSQVLIGNSCGSTGVARTFMVKVDGQWQSVGGDWKDANRETFSPLTDIPSCTLVDQYHIEPSIAPICFEAKPGTSDLYAGDTTNYTYRSRF